jgi:hypothetical protein
LNLQNSFNFKQSQGLTKSHKKLQILHNNRKNVQFDVLFATWLINEIGYFVIISANNFGTPIDI